MYVCVRLLNNMLFVFIYWFIYTDTMCNECIVFFFITEFSSDLKTYKNIKGYIITIKNIYMFSPYTRVNLDFFRPGKVLKQSAGLAV